MNLIWALTLSTFSGVIIGSMGAGGSILLVPILIYLLQMPVKTAMGVSLLTIALTSLVASIAHQRQKNVCWQLAIPWATTGMVAAYLGSRLAQYFTSNSLLLIFSLVVIISALSLIKKPTVIDQQLTAHRANYPLRTILPISSLIGILTGLIGVGGGFLLVPTLVHLKLPIKLAIGTSLVIISLQSAVGFLGYASHTEFSLSILTTVAVANMAGSLLGIELNRHLSSQQLKTAFVFLILAVGLFTLFSSL